MSGAGLQDGNTITFSGDRFVISTIFSSNPGQWRIYGADLGLQIALMLYINGVISFPNGFTAWDCAPKISES
jgi:hypothetical protein